jgi:hypothetical protein
MFLLVEVLHARERGVGEDLLVVFDLLCQRLIDCLHLQELVIDGREVLLQP